MEEGGAAVDEEIVWIAEEPAVGEQGTVDVCPAQSEPESTVVSYHVSEPTSVPEAAPSSSEPQAEERLVEPCSAGNDAEEIPENVVWIVDEPIVKEEPREAISEVTPIAKSEVEPEEHKAVNQTQDRPDGWPTREVPLENGICAALGSENGVSQGSKEESQPSKGSLDIGEDEKPKRRKSVQFSLDDKQVEQELRRPPMERPGKMKPFPSILHISPQRIDSMRTCDSELKEPTGAIFLPDHTIIVTDNQIGLILLSMTLDPICKANDPQWKSAQSPVYVRDRGSVLVSLLYKEKDSVEYHRYLAEFDINFLAVKKRILGPKWVDEYINSRDRISVAANGYIYLTVSDVAFSGVYELAPNGTWTELIHRYDHSFIDVQVLAIVGPITQLLVIEEKRGYVWHVSVRESRVVDRKLLAMVERPGALAVDQRGNLFVYDKSLGKIARIDTGDPLYRHLEDVALVQHPACHIAANFGILTVVEKLGKTVHLHRYWSMK
ncbi:hypothetical protein QR680_002416 [Steinernema hermaphroditum]|uniref:Uncharacterized protein n=1 Tax=Steinernema hermaphroditum TaxID=289476 RepID=A0AA39LI38_9BILA|nr:hypothetical protein QR680_002416 [Steinernema hermaphroditum]